MKFIHATGGREKYFKAEHVGDCVPRAIAIATGIDYKEVYDALFELGKKKRKKAGGNGSPRNGVFTVTAKKYLEGVLGWQWVATMGIGTGCKVHVREDELPNQGAIVLNLSRHFSCVKDGVLYDNHDCSRNGTRCVYGYWKAPEGWTVEQYNKNKSKVLG